MSIDDILLFYTQTFLPAYSRVTAETLSKPVQVAVEIENAFSHIAVCQEFKRQGLLEKQEEHLKKAKGHLERATLDCYKLALISVAENTKIFKKSGVIDHATIGSSESVYALHEDFNKSWHEARRKEVCGLEEEPEERIKYYISAIAKADALMESIDSTKLGKLKGFWLRNQFKSLAVSFFIGAITSISATYAYEHWLK